MAKVSLICGNERIEADAEVVSASSFLRTLLEGRPLAREIHIRNIKPSILRSVLSYCEHFKGKAPAAIARPLLTPNLRENGVDDWSADFIDSYTGRELWDLIATAYWLRLGSLVDLGCARVAALVRSKSPKELQAMLALENSTAVDFLCRTPGIAACNE